jgi:hypothetical protein
MVQAMTCAIAAWPSPRSRSVVCSSQWPTSESVRPRQFRAPVLPSFSRWCDPWWFSLERMEWEDEAVGRGGAAVAWRPTDRQTRSQHEVRGGFVRARWGLAATRDSSISAAQLTGVVLTLGQTDYLDPGGGGGTGEGAVSCAAQAEAEGGHGWTHRGGGGRTRRRGGGGWRRRRRGGGGGRGGRGGGTQPGQGRGEIRMDAIERGDRHLPAIRAPPCPSRPPSPSSSVARPLVESMVAPSCRRVSPTSSRSTSTEQSSARSPNNGKRKKRANYAYASFSPLSQDT